MLVDMMYQQLNKYAIYLLNIITGLHFEAWYERQHHSKFLHNIEQTDSLVPFISRSRFQTRKPINYHYCSRLVISF